MTRLTRALWKRRLAYRKRKLHHWHSRNNHAQTVKWTRLVNEALRTLTPPPPPVPIPANGIDVSNLQGVIDFAKVKAAGYQFVYVKAGEGDWHDPTFLRNVKAAKQAGLKVGAYQFLRPKASRNGAVEAQYFMDRLHDAGLDKGDLLPVLDVEATQLDRGGTYAYVQSFVRAMRAHGHRPMIYTGTWFYNPQVANDDFGCPLWVAAYQFSEPKLPKPWTSYAIWQYSSNGRVPGIKGDVDVNRAPDLRRVIA